MDDKEGTQQQSQKGAALCKIMEGCLEETDIRKMMRQMSSRTADFGNTKFQTYLPKASKGVFQARAAKRVKMFQTQAPDHVSSVQNPSLIPLNPGWFIGIQPVTINQQRV